MKSKTVRFIGILCVAGILNFTMGPAMADTKYSVADFNEDGMVTSEELVTYVQMNFLKMDKNNDQMLDAKEAAELEEIFDIDG